MESSTDSDLELLEDRISAFPSITCTTSTNKLHNKSCLIILNEDVIEIQQKPVNANNNNNHTLKNKRTLLEEFRISDIFGINIISCRPTLSTGVYIQLLCFPRISPKFFSLSSGRHKIRRKVQILLYVGEGRSLEENGSLAWEWVAKLQLALAEIYPFRTRWFHGGGGLSSKRRMIAVVNPKSGRRNGIRIFKKYVAPILQNCGIELELFKTEYQNHAREKMGLVSETDLTGVWGVVVVGEDHDLSQVINGFVSRRDVNRWKHIPFGIISTGPRRDGVARSLAHASGESRDYLQNPVQSATLSVARGKTQSLNLMTVQVDQSPASYAILSVGLGLLSNVEIKTAYSRWLPPRTKSSLVSKYLLANLTSYPATLTYTTVDGEEVVVPEKEFLLIHSSLTSHIGRNTDFAPTAKLGEGVLHLVYVTCKKGEGNVGRVQLLNMMHRLKHGLHLKSKCLKYVRVSEFSIQSASCDGKVKDNNDGEEITENFTVDGSLVRGKRICVKIVKPKINVFCM